MAVQLIDQGKARSDTIRRVRVSSQNLHKARILLTAQLPITALHCNQLLQTLRAMHKPRCVLVHQRRLVPRGCSDVTPGLLRRQQMKNRGCAKHRGFTVALGQKANKLLRAIEMVQQHILLPILQDQRPAVLSNQKLARKPVKQVKLLPCGL